jgi:hypothetical protein
MIFNQFEEFGNHLWHYEVTGHAMQEVLERVMGPKDQYRGMVSATGSAGTIASGDYMKQIFPSSKIVASEALQCPTLLENGFGSHRIEGIGDRRSAVHNVKNTDMVVSDRWAGLIGACSRPVVGLLATRALQGGRRQLVCLVFWNFECPLLLIFSITNWISMYRSISDSWAVGPLAGDARRVR